MSSTICGSMLLFLSTCSKILKTRPSSGVFLRPPFPALHSGVRMARVMTTSSGFFCVLYPHRQHVSLSLYCVGPSLGILRGKVRTANRSGLHLVNGLLARRQLGDEGGETFGGHCVMLMS